MEDTLVLIPCTFWTVFAFIAIVVAIWAIVDRLEQKEETEKINILLEDTLLEKIKENKDGQ